MRVRLVGKPKEPPRQYHLDLLDGMDRICFPRDDPYPKRGSYWWIVWDAREPVGFAGLRVLRKENAGFLCRVGVLQRAIGRGIQRRLISVRERMAKRLGLQHLITYTGPGSHASAVNLLRCGYEIYTPSWCWGVRGAIYFRKDL